VLYLTFTIWRCPDRETFLCWRSKSSGI
jgi:hypothetical protein